MAQIAPLFAKVAGLVGSTSAATGAGLLGTVVSGVAGLASASYQSRILKNQAAIKEQEAKHERFRGQVEAQEADFAAARQIGLDDARQGGSGLDFSSFSLQRRRNMNRVLARRDAMRIQDNANRGALSLENAAAADRAEAKGVKSAAVFNLAGKGFEFGSTMISDATLVNRKKASTLTRKARTI